MHTCNWQIVDYPHDDWISCPWNKRISKFNRKESHLDLITELPTMNEKEALTIISNFLVEEWANLKPEDIKVTRLK